MKRKDEKEQQLAIIAAAAEYYAKVLRDDPAGDAGRRYLSGRGIEVATLRRYRIGFAAPGALTVVLAGFPRELQTLAEAAGGVGNPGADIEGLVFFIERVIHLTERLHVMVDLMRHRFDQQEDVGRAGARERGRHVEIVLVLDENLFTQRAEDDTRVLALPDGSRLLGGVSMDITALKNFLITNGLYVFNFKNILFVVPPLIITKEQLDEGLNLIDEGLSELMDRPA